MHRETRYCRCTCNMETSRSTRTTMRVPLLLVIQLSFFLQIEAQLPSQCTPDTLRNPATNDIQVKCDTKFIYLSIILCPIYFSNYNESVMYLNHQIRPECLGTANWAADPPVLEFKISLNESHPSACNCSYKVNTDVGTGEFSEISRVQTFNISGQVFSVDFTQSMISYSSMVHYKFSCEYPMQYAVNNTQLVVSGADLAWDINNSTFVSTLTMNLYSDIDFTLDLVIPKTGVDLKTKIYVKIVATNLTDRFNVLLDRCYTSTNAYGKSSLVYDLFVGCNRDPQTFVIENGVRQHATFSFEAFRFVAHQNQTVSTFYLHCITRLCEVDSCPEFLPNCNETVRKRRKRDTTDNAGVSGNNTISSTSAIIVKEVIDTKSDAMGLVVPVAFTWTMMCLSLGVTFSLTTQT